MSTPPPILDAESSLLDHFQRPPRLVVSREELTEQRHRALIGSFVALLASLKSLNGVLESLNSSLKAQPDSWDHLSDALAAPSPFEEEPVTLTFEPAHDGVGLVEVFRRDHPVMHDLALAAVA